MNTKKTPRSRLIAISGATLALVVAGGAVASAHPGGDADQRGFGPARGQLFQRGAERMGHGFAGLGGGLRDAFGAGINSIIRHETVLQTEDGVMTRRQDNGTVTSATDTAVAYTLATGETVEVSIDDETQVIAFSEETIERGFRSRIRMIPSEIAVTEVASGSEVTVLSESQDDGSFVAQRIVIRPDLEEPTATDAETDANAAADAAAESVPATDA